MADIEQLKQQLAQAEAKIASLRPAVEAANIKLNQAQQALTAFLDQPGNIHLTDLSNAKRAAQADPTNAELQQRAQQLQSAWDAQQAQYLPLLKARDDAGAALVQAKTPLVEAEGEAADIDVEIAKIDPTQASPEAVQYLKENGGLPVTNPTPSTPDPSTPITQPDAGVTTPGTTADPITPIEQPSPDTTEAGLNADNPVTPAEQQYPDPTEYENLAYQNLQEDVAATQAANNQRNNQNTAQGINTALNNARAQATLQDVKNFQASKDWRVKLTLAPGANYLYMADEPGILLPLRQSNGVVFPYTPQIAVNYSAQYDSQDLTHNNYKVFQYRSSSVDSVSITGDFTAQDTFEANYLLAVIHFFRSITKMFYGQDQNPNNGVPPPLCYLTGLGAFQFDNHPLVISSFSYNLPNDMDYIRAGSVTTNAGVNLSNYTIKGNTSNSRTQAAGLPNGANPPSPNFQSLSSRTPTYVPTKMQIVINAFPIVTRNDISNNFSLKKYATGELLQGSKRTPRGGIW